MKREALKCNVSQLINDRVRIPTQFCLTSTHKTTPTHDCEHQTISGLAKYIRGILAKSTCHCNSGNNSKHHTPGVSKNLPRPSICWQQMSYSKSCIDICSQNKAETKGRGWPKLSSRLRGPMREAETSPSDSG